MGGALPPALLCAALGVALSFAQRRAIVVGLTLMAVAALATSFTAGALLEGQSQPVLMTGFAAVVGLALLVHLPRGPNLPLAAACGLVAGALAGGEIAAAGRTVDLAYALPAALLSVPGRWLVETRRGLAVKVVASWLAAVAVLALALTLAVPTPGYAPDHME